MEGAAYGLGRATVRSGMVTCRCTHRDLEDNKEAGLMPGVPLLGCRKWSELSTDPAQLRVHSTGQTGAQGAVGQGEQSCPYSPGGHPKPLTSDLKPPPTNSPPRLQSLDLAHVHPVSLEELLELVTH